MLIYPIIFFTIIAFIIFLFMFCKRKLFDPFVRATPLRLSIWNKIRLIVLPILSLILIIKSAERWYYFCDEISYTSKKFLDMNYADQIESEVYLMDQEKLIRLFEGNPPEPGFESPAMKNKWALTPPKPSHPFYYVVIRLKNRGDKVAWGIIQWGSSNTGNCQPKLSSEVEIGPLAPDMHDFTHIVFKSDIIDPKYLPDSYPEMQIYWTKLFTSSKENL